MGSAQQKRVEEDSINLPDKQSVFKFKPYKLKLNNSEKFEKLSPKPRSGHRIVCDDINMYSFGGYNPSLSPSDEADLANDSVWLESKPLFRELWKFNISTASWKKLDALKIPDILASNAVLLSGHVLMVYGGTGIPFGTNCSKDLYICDLSSEAEQIKFNLISASGNCPQPHYGHAIVLTNHYLYTIGGTTGFEYTCDIHRLNLRDGMWEAVYTCKGTDYEPEGRYRHEVAFNGSKIFVLGGGTSFVAFDFETLFAFDLETCKWEKIETKPDSNPKGGYPSPRRCHSCVQLQQFAFVIGGFNGRTILKDIWRLDLVTFQWYKFQQFSLDRGAYFHSSCLTSSGKLITFGGIIQTENHSKRSAAVHSAWLCIPKLKEICWEAVIFYHPDLVSLHKDKLLSLGLPYEFVQRLDLAK